MARFYGWTDDYLVSMDTDIFQDYWLAIDAIKSIEQIDDIQSSSFHSFKQEDRKKINSRLNKKIQSIVEQDSKAVLSIEDAAKLLARKMMHG